MHFATQKHSKLFFYYFICSLNTCRTRGRRKQCRKNKETFQKRLINYWNKSLKWSLQTTSQLSSWVGPITAECLQCSGTTRPTVSQLWSRYGLQICSPLGDVNFSWSGLRIRAVKYRLSLFADDTVFYLGATHCDSRVKSRWAARCEEDEEGSTLCKCLTQQLEENQSHFESLKQKQRISLCSAQLHKWTSNKMEENMIVIRILHDKTLISYRDLQRKDAWKHGNFLVHQYHSNMKK